MTDDLDPLVTQLVNKVFATMLQMKAEPAPGQAPLPEITPHVAGTIGFSGSITGVIHLNCSETFARTITATMLGMQEWQIDGNEMVNDVLGEITNMIAGNVASELRNRGGTCAITIPSIVRGNSFSICHVTGSKSIICNFNCEGNPVVVELVLKG
ncbi:MAG TPA: chemotaxis protein CheX [Candidatus Limnocylindria bacterium]|jgi:chemotaxis protein CheX|nr:chemotaxis protein CheX [Candidatus Limnocylindria bacterium]